MDSCFFIIIIVDFYFFIISIKTNQGVCGLHNRFVLCLSNFREHLLYLPLKLTSHILLVDGFLLFLILKKCFLATSLINISLTFYKVNLNLFDLNFIVSHYLICHFRLIILCSWFLILWTYYMHFWVVDSFLNSLYNKFIFFAYFLISLILFSSWHIYYFFLQQIFFWTYFS